VIPGIMMVDLERLFEDLRDAGVSAVSFNLLRFAGYEESRKMFEEAARMSADEALAGRDDTMTKLTALVKRFGMEPTARASWWTPDAEDVLSLDGFCQQSNLLGEKDAVTLVP